MAYELRDGQGSMFKNKKTKDSQPDYAGEFKLDGKMYRLSAWIKEGKNGKYMSLSVQAKEEKKNTLDDDICF